MKKEEINIAIVLSVILLFCLVHPVCGKRAFAIRMRGKSNSGAGLSRYSRKNYHQTHMSDNVSGSMVRNPPVPDAQPARPVGLSGDTGGPVGPPPAYPGLGHQAVPAGGAPPAYSRINPPSYAETVGYSSHGYNYGQQADLPARHYDYNTNQNNLHTAYSENKVGGYGQNYGYHRGSNPFSVGNILTGVALWQLGHGMAHHHHHDHYQNYYNHIHNKDDTRSTLPPEIENPHIQVNADFDFGPSPAAVTVQNPSKASAEANPATSPSTASSV